MEIKIVLGQSPIGGPSVKYEITIVYAEIIETYSFTQQNKMFAPVPVTFGEGGCINFKQVCRASFPDIQKYFSLCLPGNFEHMQ
jgi:hypothetical protein